MNLSISVYYSIEGKIQEPVKLDIDDEWLEFLLVHYLNKNYANAELEDFVINGICLE